jgi:hypothetical protein
MHGHHDQPVSPPSSFALILQGGMPLTTTLRSGDRSDRLALESWLLRNRFLDQQQLVPFVANSAACRQWRNGRPPAMTIVCSVAFRAIDDDRLLVAVPKIGQPLAVAAGRRAVDFIVAGPLLASSMSSHCRRFGQIDEPLAVGAKTGVPTLS